MQGLTYPAAAPINSRIPLQQPPFNDRVNYTTTVHEQVIFTPPPLMQNGGIHYDHRTNLHATEHRQSDGFLIPQPPLGPRKLKTRNSFRRAAKLLLNKSKQALSGSDPNISSGLANDSGNGDLDSVKCRSSKGRARMGDLLNGPRVPGTRPRGKENVRAVCDDTTIHHPRDSLGPYGGGDGIRRFHSAENIDAGSGFCSGSSHYSGSEMTHDDSSFYGGNTGSAGYVLRRYNSGPIQQRNKHDHHRGYHTADSDSADSNHRGDSQYMAVQNRIGSGRRAKTTREALRKLNRSSSSFEGPQQHQQRNGRAGRQGPSGPLKADHNIQPFHFNERLQDFPVRWKGQGARPKYSSTESLETESVSHEILPDTAIRSDSEDSKRTRRHSRATSPSRSVRFEDEEETPGEPMKRSLSAPVSTRRQWSERGKYNPTSGNEGHSINDLGKVNDQESSRLSRDGHQRLELENGSIPNGNKPFAIDGHSNSCRKITQGREGDNHYEENDDKFDHRQNGQPLFPSSSEQKERLRHGKENYHNHDPGSREACHSLRQEDYSNGEDHLDPRTSGEVLSPSYREGQYTVEQRNRINQSAVNEFDSRQGILNGNCGDFDRNIGSILRGQYNPEADAGSDWNGKKEQQTNGNIPSTTRTSEENGLTLQEQDGDVVEGALEPVYEVVKRAKKTYSTRPISYSGDAIEAHSAWEEYKKRLEQESRRPNSFAYNPDHYTKMSGSNSSITSNSSISEKMQHLGHATIQTFGKMRRAISLDRINKSPPKTGDNIRSPLKRSPSLRSLSSYLGKKKDKLMGSFTDLSSSQRRSSSTGGLNMTGHVEPVDVTNPSYMRKIGRVLEVHDDGTQLVRLVKPPNGPFGFYIAKGASMNGPGIFVKRISDGHPAKILAGLLQVGDEILEINGQWVKEEKCIDRVYDLILDNDDLLLKIRPLVRRGDEIL